MTTITTAQERQMETIESAARAAQPAPHTPGPWKVSTESRYREGEYFVFASDPSRAVASSCRAYQATECRANADLSAAAPELLSALKGLLIDAHSLDRRQTIAELEATARAAIAKAEGRS